MIFKWEKELKKAFLGLSEPGKPKTTIDAKADAFWKEEATKNDLLFFAIPQIEYLKGPVDINTGKFKNNPGWSVNGCKTIFGFNYLLNNNGTLAHEFGHAFGLEHTFSDEKEVVKKKEVKVVEESKFHSEIKNKFGIMKMFIPKDISSKEYSKFWDKGYPEKRYAVNSFDTLYKELLVLVNDESEKSKNTIITKEDNSHVVKGKFNLEKGDTKENFMDYLRLDDDRKAFNKEQIDIILK